MKQSSKTRMLTGIYLARGRLAWSRLEASPKGCRLLSHGIAPFNLDPRHDDADLVSEHLKECFRENHIKSRHCLLAAPLPWFSTRRVNIEGIPAEELEDFLILDNESNSGKSSDSFLLGHTLSNLPGEPAKALVATLETSLGVRLSTIFRQAGARLVGISPAVLHSSNQKAEANLLIAAGGIDLVVNSGDKPILLRQLALPPGNRDWQSMPFIETISRNLEISLGTLPAVVGDQIHALQVFGETPSIAPALAALGKQISLPVKAYPLPEGFPELSPEESAAALIVHKTCKQGDSPLIQAPAIRHPFFQRLHRIPRRAGLVASLLAILLVAALVVVYHQHRVVKQLEKELAAVQPAAKVAEQARAELRRLAPWHEQTPHYLETLKLIAKAFPPYGPVWATALTIDPQGDVTLTGVAAGEQDWLTALDALRATAPDLRVLRANNDNSRSGASLSFSVAFAFNGKRPELSPASTPKEEK